MHLSQLQAGRLPARAWHSLSSLMLVSLIGCSRNIGMPAYRGTTPPSLSPVADPRPADSVRVEFESLPWWTSAGTYQRFILGFDESLGPRSSGQTLGPMRSRDILIPHQTFETIRCAWMIVPMGETRPCPTMSRSEAMQIAKVHIERVTADLREQAGVAGVALVAKLRCFAAQSRRDAKLWCEGVARKPHEPIGRLALGNDPSAVIGRESRTPSSRLVLHADGSVGFFGSVPTVATTVGLRYRPIELGFHIVDLGREELARGLVGVGLTGLARKALGDTRFDGILGASALAVAANGATNPNFKGLFSGFVGLAYQTPWRISGAAQPFIQFRAGVAQGSDLAKEATPIFELHLGLSTPEQR